MWHIGMLSNHWILGGVAVQAVGQIAITYVPAMNSLFQTAPISADAWIRVFCSRAACLGDRGHRQANTQPIAWK